jgi:hypothetical protein
VFEDCRSLRQLALGDVGTWLGVVAKVITGDGKLDWLELIGRNFEPIPATAIVTWPAGNAVVVSAVCKGRRLGRL